MRNEAGECRARAARAINEKCALLVYNREVLALDGYVREAAPGGVVQAGVGITEAIQIDADSVRLVRWTGKKDQKKTKVAVYETHRGKTLENPPEENMVPISGAIPVVALMEVTLGKVVPM